MIASVKAYYNTGLQVNNSLDSLSLLDSLGFSSRTFDSIAIKQDRGRISIRINTSYDNIKDADYIKINDVGYWVTGINMLNDNVAQVGLQQDFVTTVGISNLEVVSGWCTRRHVTDDTLYANTLDEPFAPSSPIKVDFGGEITGMGSSDGYSYIIVSSIDLANLPATAKAYLDSANDKVLVPDLAVVPNSGNNTTYTSHISGNAKSCKLPATQAYIGNSQVILEALSSVRSLGVESCLVACYVVPEKWVAVNASGGAVTDMTDQDGFYTSALPAIPGTYKNNKVFSGQFQRIINYSLATGESSNNRVEDIQSNGVIYWRVAADPRYSGHPVCMPKYVHGAENQKLLSCINGAQWQNIPITYQGASGYGFLQNRLGNDIDRGYYDALSGVVNSIFNVGDSALNSIGAAQQDQLSMDYGIDSDLATSRFGAGARTGISFGRSALGAASAVRNYEYNKRNWFNSYNQAMATVDVQFPRIPSFQDYIGNSFYEMRYRLSDNDMVRFDNFLTQFGYAVDEIFTPSCMTGRTHFNYIQGREISIKKSGVPQYLLDGMAKVIEAGVRIWHTAPASGKLIDNPIAS